MVYKIPICVSGVALSGPMTMNEAVLQICTYVVEFNTM